MDETILQKSSKYKEFALFASSEQPALLKGVAQTDGASVSAPTPVGDSDLLGAQAAISFFPTLSTAFEQLQRHWSTYRAKLRHV